MKRRLVIAALVSLAAPPGLRAQVAAAPAPRMPLPNDSVAIARRYIDWMYSGRFDSLVAHMPPGGTAAELETRWASIVARAGTEASLVQERWVMRGGKRQYWRVARFSDFADEPVVVRLVIERDGSLGGIGVNPESATPPVDPEP